MVIDPTECGPSVWNHIAQLKNTVSDYMSLHAVAQKEESHINTASHVSGYNSP